MYYLLPTVHLFRRKQKENQEDLLRNANENTLKALRASDGGGRQAAGRKVSAITTYARVADMPSSRDLAIQARTLLAQPRHPCVRCASLTGSMVPWQESGSHLFSLFTRASQNLENRTLLSIIAVPEGCNQGVPGRQQCTPDLVFVTA